MEQFIRRVTVYSSTVTTSVIKNGSFCVAMPLVGNKFAGRRAVIDCSEIMACC